MSVDGSRAHDPLAVRKNVTVREHMGALEIAFHRRSWPKLAGFSWVIGVFSAGALYFMSQDEPVRVVFAGMCALFAALATYGAASLVANKTTVTVTPGHVRVTSGPLPLLPSIDLASADIAQLTTRSTRSGPCLFVRTRDGRETPLVAGLADAAQAQTLERAIEDRLRIPDLPPGAQQVPWHVEEHEEIAR